MTLLLNLLGQSGIHTSSDYRLTDVRTQRTIEDMAGSKQFRVTRPTWSADVSFTGIAQVSGWKTRDWIAQVLSGTPNSSEVAVVVADLARAGTKELLALPRNLRQLTIVLAVTEKRKPSRLFVISSFDRPGWPPLGNTLEHLAAYEIPSDKPRAFIFGFKSAVSRADRKLLKNLSRSACDAAGIRAALSGINRRSAKRSHDCVSEECMVTSLFPDGSSAFENFGGTAGIPHNLIGSTNIGELITRNFKPLPGKQITFIQGRSAQSAGKSEVTTTPMNVSAGNTLIVAAQGASSDSFVSDALGNTFTRMPRPVGSDNIDEETGTELTDGERGEPRMIAFASSTASALIAAPDGSKFGSIIVAGVSGTAAVVKNLRVSAVLNTVSVQMNPAARYEGPPFSLQLQLPNAPTVDGVQPHSWVYAFDVSSIDGTYIFSIRQNSIAFRSANYKVPMPAIASTEELVMVAPRNPVLLRTSAESPTAQM